MTADAPRERQNVSYWHYMKLVLQEDPERVYYADPPDDPETAVFLDEMANIDLDVLRGPFMLSVHQAELALLDGRTPTDPGWAHWTADEMTGLRLYLDRLFDERRTKGT